jgi:hypothetical protein
MFGGRYFHPRTLDSDLQMPARNSSSTDVWSIGAIIVFLMWGEYLPKEIEYIRRSQHGLTAADCERIA